MTQIRFSYLWYKEELVALNLRGFQNLSSLPPTKDGLFLGDFQLKSCKPDRSVFLPVFTCFYMFIWALTLLAGCKVPWSELLNILGKITVGSPPLHSQCTGIKIFQIKYFIFFRAAKASLENQKFMQPASVSCMCHMPGWKSHSTAWKVAGHERKLGGIQQDATEPVMAAFPRAGEAHKPLPLH